MSAAAGFRASAATRRFASAMLSAAALLLADPVSLIRGAMPLFRAFEPLHTPLSRFRRDAYASMLFSAAAAIIE